MDGGKLDLEDICNPFIYSKVKGKGGKRERHSE
jgi:hypothetical protein